MQPDIQYGSKYTDKKTKKPTNPFLVFGVGLGLGWLGHEIYVVYKLAEMGL